MPKLLRSPAFGVGLLILSSSTMAQSPSEKFLPCGTFALTGGKFDFVAIDLGPKGASVGDERLGDRELLDDDGAVVGTLRWVSRVVDMEEGRADDEFALNQLVYTLPDGTLHATGQLRYENILAEGTQPTEIAIAVSGGTGSYEMSEGVIAATFEPDGTARFEFQLYCD